MKDRDTPPTTSLRPTTTNPVHRPDDGAAETAVRAALAGHRWPAFGDGLQQRLMTIREHTPAAATGPFSSVGSRSGHAVHRDDRRAGRGRTWRVAAASAISLASIAGLTLLLARMDGRRAIEPANPVDGPGIAAPRGAITEALIGHLTYLSSPTAVEEPVAFMALDMRTGRPERRWLGPARTMRGVDTAALSPDGTRVALMRGRQRTGEPSLIYVRGIERNAPPAGVLETSDDINDLRWSRDGRSLFYAVTTPGRPVDVNGYPPPDQFPDAQRWELHQVSLEARTAFGRLAEAIGGAPSAGDADDLVRPGADRIIARVGADVLDPADHVSWTAFDEERRRLVLQTWRYPKADATSLVVVEMGDDAAPASVSRYPLSDGWPCWEVPNPSRLTCVSTTSSVDGWSADLLDFDLASGEASLAMTGTIASDVSRTLRPLDKRWFVTHDVGEQERQPLLAAVDVTAYPPRLLRVQGVRGNPLAFAPDTSVLVTTGGQLVDLDALGRGALPVVADLPWDLPTRLATYTNVKVVGWMPDAMPTATNAPAATEAATDATALTPADDALDLTPVVTVDAPLDPTDYTAGPALDIVAWSPDSRWLTFWTADGSDHYERWRWPGTLNVLDAVSGAVCTQQGVTQTTHSDSVFWEPDGRMAVRTEGRVVAGRPCETLTPEPASRHALPGAPPGVTPSWAYAPPHESVDMQGPEDSAISPDGTLVATTTAVGEDGDRYVTQLVPVDGGAVVAEARWRSNGGIGDMGVGGAWLPDGRFMVFYSNDQGPLIIERTGRVDPVAERLFELPASGLDVATLSASLLPSASGAAWHVVLEGAGRLKLYHADAGRVESLPASELWAEGVSADRTWLLLDGHDGLQIRPLEDTDAPFRTIAESDGVEPYDAFASDDGRYIAFVRANEGRVAVVSFPDGDVVARWHLGGYHAGSLRWSPDGRAVAIDGFANGGGGVPVARALFVVPMPPS